MYLSDNVRISKVPVSESLRAQYRVIPVRVYTEDGYKIYIDRVTDIRRQASTKAGGLGIRYTCLATSEDKQKEIYLYKDEDTWFMEEVF